MDRRMLVITGIATVALALAACGGDNDSSDRAAQAPPPTEVDATTGTEGAGSNHSATDKTLYFNRSDASQR